MARRSPLGSGRSDLAAAELHDVMSRPPCVANTCYWIRDDERIAVTFGVSMGLFALVSVLPVNGLAQSGTTAARPSATDAVAGRTSKAGGAAVVEPKGTDMHLWSFGDCDRNFPYVNAPEHQECVRVVGSDAAKDARAVHYCEVSHAKDPAEATQCKAAYFANKTEAEHEGFRAVASNAAPVVALAAPAPKRDKAAEIAALTRALTAPEPEESARHHGECVGIGDGDLAARIRFRGQQHVVDPDHAVAGRYRGGLSAQDGHDGFHGQIDIARERQPQDRHRHAGETVLAAYSTRGPLAPLLVSS